MSKETFWATAKDSLYPQAVIEQVIRLIEDHGGSIGWKVEPKEPPPPAVCTCPRAHKINDDKGSDFGKPGPHHVSECLFSTTF